jgi:tRNA (cmo5U34)-methyltransferase
MTSPVPPINRWRDVDHALTYLEAADDIPHRTEGEAVLLDHLPADMERFLDLGCGDGRLTALVRTTHPRAEAVALDFSPPMLTRARERFADTPQVTVAAHDLDDPLPELGPFDAVVSSFAIHHVVDARKVALLAEVFAPLEAGGVFLNLEHVASPTEALHKAFLDRLGTAPADDDPSNKLVAVEPQLGWMRAAGFTEVDCHWKWLELALLGGVRPASG